MPHTEPIRAGVGRLGFQALWGAEERGAARALAVH